MISPAVLSSIAALPAWAPVTVIAAFSVIEIPASWAAFPASFNTLAVIAPNVELVSSSSIIAPPFTFVIKLAAPVTVRVPLSVIWPPAVTLSAAVTVEAPRMIALVSANVTFAPVTSTAPVKSCVVRSRITSCPAAEIVVVPSTSRAPLSVTAPPAVTFRFPLTALAPSIRPFASCSVTFCPRVITTVPKSFVFVSREMSLVVAPASRVAVPPTETDPVSDIIPEAVNEPSPVVLRLTRPMVPELVS